MEPSLSQDACHKPTADTAIAPGPADSVPPSPFCPSSPPAAMRVSAGQALLRSHQLGSSSCASHSTSGTHSSSQVIFTEFKRGSDTIHFTCLHCTACYEAYVNHTSISSSRIQMLSNFWYSDRSSDRGDFITFVQLIRMKRNLQYFFASVSISEHTVRQYSTTRNFSDR